MLIGYFCDPCFPYNFLRGGGGGVPSFETHFTGKPPSGWVGSAPPHSPRTGTPRHGHEFSRKGSEATGGRALVTAFCKFVICITTKSLCLILVSNSPHSGTPKRGATGSTGAFTRCHCVFRVRKDPRTKASFVRGLEPSRLAGVPSGSSELHAETRYAKAPREGSRALRSPSFGSWTLTSLEKRMRVARPNGQDLRVRAWTRLNTQPPVANSFTVAYTDGPSSDCVPSANALKRKPGG